MSHKATFLAAVAALLVSGTLVAREPVRPMTRSASVTPVVRGGWAKFNDAEYQALGLPIPPGTPHIELPRGRPGTGIGVIPASINTFGARSASTLPR